MQDINLRSGVPIYKQIIDNFKEQIISHELAPESKLPSIRGLASDLQINPNTIKKAYIILEQENFIYSVQGSGSFVAAINKQQLDIERNEMRKLVVKTWEKAKNLNMDEEMFLAFIKTCIRSEYDE